VTFRVGAIPEDPMFVPSAEGWRAIREPGPLLAQAIAIPIAVVSILLTAIAILRFTNISSDGASLSGVIVVAAVVIPIHELFHALVHPGHGLRRATVVGVWPRRGLFYAHFEGPMRSGRFMLVLLAPTLALTVLPLAASALIGASSWLWGAVPLLNSLFACVDLLGAVLLLLQVPRHALARNKGWRTYWRPIERETT
jgi:hypothetical protein